MKLYSGEFWFLLTPWNPVNHRHLCNSNTYMILHCDNGVTNHSFLDIKDKITWQHVFKTTNSQRYLGDHPFWWWPEIHDGLKKSRVAAVCGKQYSVTEARKMFAGSDVLVCAAVGFPPRRLQHQAHAESRLARYGMYKGNGITPIWIVSPLASQRSI